MQIQRVQNKNTCFGAILRINNPNELSAKSLDILTKKAKKIGYETDVISIRLGKPEGFNVKIDNRNAFERRTIIGSMTELSNQELDRQKMGCVSYGDMSMSESTAKRISKYLDELTEKFQN